MRTPPHTPMQRLYKDLTSFCTIFGHGLIYRDQSRCLFISNHHLTKRNYHSSTYLLTGLRQLHHIFVGGGYRLLQVPNQQPFKFLGRSKSKLLFRIERILCHQNITCCMKKKNKSKQKTIVQIRK